MARQTVKLRVPIDDDWDAGTRLEVYSDFGTGTLDMKKPLTVRGVDLFAGQHAAKGVGRQPVGKGRIGDSKPGRPVRGIGRSITGVTPVGTGPTFAQLTVEVPAAFGKWKFAVRAVDAQGVVQSEELAVLSAMVSGTEPPPLKSFTLSGYDAIKDRFTFDFVKNVE